LKAVIKVRALWLNTVLEGLAQVSFGQRRTNTLEGSVEASHRVVPPVLHDVRETMMPPLPPSVNETEATPQRPVVTRAAAVDLMGLPTTTALVRSARLIPHATDLAIVEHYRKLRTKILQLQSDNPFRSLVLTSAFPQDGKTLTVLNLALSFAMLPGFKILAVDGDLRRGTLGNWLGMDNKSIGLSNVLDGSASLDDVVLRSNEVGFHFITRGTSQASPGELLHSSQLASIFKKLAETFDLILVDSPPVNLITDVQLLAANCDAVLLVARAFSTTRKGLEKAAQDLSPFRVIGSVLNAGTDRSIRYRRYKGYY
jgi:capsular exopolysaccharide synthesis family protein